MTIKICPTCGVEKSVDQFATHKKAKDGKNWQCIECHKQRMKAQRARISEIKKQPITEKCCSTCKDIKCICLFSRNKVTKDGFTNVCKACASIYRRRKEERYRNKNRATKFIYVDGHTKKCSSCKQILPVVSFYTSVISRDGLNKICKSCGKKSSNKWKRENLEKYLLKSARNGAKKRGIEFRITEKDIIIPDVCPVFGFPLTLDGKRSTSPSIDRIDNTKGYIPGNVVVVSIKANHVKSDCTLDELKRMVEFYSALVSDVTL